MSADWPSMKISNVAVYRNNKRIPLKSLDRAKRQGIYPYYGASGVVDYIDDYIFDGTYLLISEDGENLRSRKTPVAFKAHGKFWVNNHAHILEEKEEGILDYLEYYFSQLDLTPYITGAVQPKLNKANLDTIEIPIPPLEERRAINGTLNSLTYKIDLNHQINQTLEQMAQAIFKSWFVDFEPVKAKIAALEAGGSEEDALLAAMQAISGKGEAELTRLQAEQPEQYAELRATAELFPSAMQDSELGEIPEGWEVTDLKSSTIEIRRGISPKYTEEGGIQVINQKCIRNHKVDFSLARRNDTSKRKIDGREIQIGDVLVNSTGVGTLGRLAPVRHLPEPSVADSHVTVIRANNRLISNAFLAGLMITSEPLIEASGAGSTGQTELRKQVLEEIVFARPSLKLSRAYEGAVEPMGQQMACIERQLVSLASTRDVILPKLLSGDLSVPNKGNQPKAEPLSPLQGVE
ncbi:restriction endonuclease subunit S [Marinobacter sp. 1-3A]|uniref:restriction endonuclease subunit S n=1 Tax=Marinobacter sp. 1-3A TaxID=2582920 RepID=UPI001D10A126|nr:restriction endonuclease subunit S [Marinobacter sp. 1-3A]